MPIYRPSELHQFLNELGVSPQEEPFAKLSYRWQYHPQNRRILGINADDVVLEVGPVPDAFLKRF